MCPSANQGPRGRERIEKSQLSFSCRFDSPLLEVLRPSYLDVQRSQKTPGDALRRQKWRNGGAPLRITTWNLRGGGGKRIPSIAERLLAEAPDLCVLTEYRSRPGSALKSELQLQHSVESRMPENHNGVLAYGSSSLHEVRTHNRPLSGHRWLAVQSRGIKLLGVHIPNQSERWNKDDFWEKLLLYARRHRLTPGIIAGDFNTGLPADTENEAFKHAWCFQTLLDMGWVDAWRAVHGDSREYTWYSPNGGNGYRLDHIFLAKPLAVRLIGASHDHKVREQGLSDHSLLTVDLSD